MRAHWLTWWCEAGDIQIFIPWVPKHIKYTIIHINPYNIFVSRVFAGIVTRYIVLNMDMGTIWDNALCQHLPTVPSLVRSNAVDTTLPERGHGNISLEVRGQRVQTNNKNHTVVLFNWTLSIYLGIHWSISPYLYVLLSMSLAINLSILSDLLNSIYFILPTTYLYDLFISLSILSI